MAGDWRLMRSILLIFFGFLSSPSVWCAEGNPFEVMENMLLDAEGVSLTFELSSTGAVASSLSGSLSLCDGNRTLILSKGEIFGQEVRNSLRSDGQVLKVNQQQKAIPLNLNEAIVVGFLRMGLLHNLVRLSGNRLPDHAEGDVSEWVRIPGVGENRNGIFFDILVAGNRAGRAQLEISADGLPLTRSQTVYFGSEEMKVSETYANFSLTCRM
jgi:hypothetical protein